MPRLGVSSISGSSDPAQTSGGIDDVGALMVNSSPVSASVTTAPDGDTDVARARVINFAPYAAAVLAIDTTNRVVFELEVPAHEGSNAGSRMQYRHEVTRSARIDS